MSKFLDALKASLIGVAFFHFVAVMYGAPFVDNWERTLFWSALMSILTVFPQSFTNGIKEKEFKRWISLQRPKTKSDVFCTVPAVGAILGAWFGAFVIPLDWDRPWQVWPISCTYGAIGGYLIGLVASLIATTLFSHKIFSHKYN